MFDQDIKKFLAKPVVISSGSLSNLNTVSSFTDISCPSAIIAANPVWQHKLNGYLGFRATIVFTITLNASKFQMGRYIAAFIHTGGLPSSDANTALHINYHKNTLEARTQLHRVEFDVSCDTTAQLKVPYVSALNYSQLTNSTTFGDIGVFHMSPYVSITDTSGTSAYCGFTVYAHFEDITLVGAANPQMGISDQEADKPSVSDVALSASKFLSSLAKMPSLSGIARPAAWVTGAIGNTAKSIGWSKPPMNSEAKRVVRDTYPGFCNSDVLDTSKKQGLFQSNEVGVLPGFSGQDEDELNISYLAGKFAHDSIFTFDVSNSGGDTLYSQAVSPFAGVAQRTVLGGLTVLDYTPLQFVSSQFKYWRGSIRYKLKFVRTEFHSGRIAVCFFPNETLGNVSTSFSYANSHYVQRHIVDLREHNEIIFTVPYVSTTPYKPVSSTGASSATGTIAIFVVDKLVAPSTVPQNIKIIMEIAGGEDIEFSVPSNNTTTPVYNVIPQMGDMVCSYGSHMLGNSEISPSTVINSEACQGERVFSLRSLLKAYAVNSFTTVPGAAAPFLNVVPFGVPCAYNSLTNFHPSTTGDLYTSLSAIFLFSRGGIRYKILPIVNSSIRPGISYNFYPTDGFASVANYASVSTNNFSGTTSYITERLSTAQTYHNLNNNYGYEFEVPQYHIMHSRVNHQHLVNVNIPYAFTNGFATKTLVSVTDGSSNMSVNALVSRAMADDGNFGRFISIGPMYVGIIRSA